MRTNFYIDGFNLYKGCVEGTAFKWLNLVEFCRRSFPTPDNVLNRVRYFTARVRAWPHDPSQPERQAAYLRALETLPEVSIHYGQFKTSNHWMRLADLRKGTPAVAGGVTRSNWETLAGLPAGTPGMAFVERSEEKGSDVNLATHLLMDGFQNDYEAAVVVTNDPDQREPIRLVRQELNKKVVVLFPVRIGRRPSNDLKSVASTTHDLDLALLAACQFPPILTTAKGRQIRKPAAW